MSKIVARREAVYGLYRYGDFVAIARKTGLSAPTVSRALRGEPCTISTARKICDLFGNFGFCLSRCLDVPHFTEGVHIKRKIIKLIFIDGYR